MSGYRNIGIFQRVLFDLYKSTQCNHNTVTLLEDSGMAIVRVSVIKITYEEPFYLLQEFSTENFNKVSQLPREHGLRKLFRRLS